MQEEITFNLTEPFNYAEKGEQVEAKFITLKAPTSRNMSHIAFLKQAFYRALPKNQEVKNQDDVKKDDEITGEDIMTILSASMDVELSSVLVTAKELFASKDIALVDGETKVTKPILDDMGPDDFFAMTGEYLANFILASVLQKMNNA